MRPCSSSTNCQIPQKKKKKNFSIKFHIHVYMCICGGRLNERGNTQKVYKSIYKYIYNVSSNLKNMVRHEKSGTAKRQKRKDINLGEGREIENTYVTFQIGSLTLCFQAIVLSQINLQMNKSEQKVKIAQSDKNIKSQII